MRIDDSFALKEFPRINRCIWAESQLERLKGLLGCQDLPEGTVMGFKRCPAVHTLGMRFALDLIFVDKHGNVVKIVRDVRPGRLVVWGGRRAVAVFEARAGWIGKMAATDDADSTHEERATTTVTSVERSVGTVGAFTMLSRVLGLGREMLQSRLIGAEWQQSAFTLAFMIPNAARRLFGEGALTAAFVPVFKNELENHGHAKAERLARAVMGLVALILSSVVILAVVGISTALGVSKVLPVEWGEKTFLALRLTRILIPYMLFICLAAFGMGVLNALGRFAAPAVAPCFLNVLWIGSLAVLFFVPGQTAQSRLVWVSVAILAAGVLQMVFLLHKMRCAGIRPGLSCVGWRDSTTRQVFRSLGIAALGTGAVQLNYLLDQVLAQYATPWAAGIIGYSERLMELPLGVVGTAFGTVLLPTFSGYFAKSDKAGANAAFTSAVRSMLFIMVPASVGLAMLSVDATRVIYEGREFDTVATLRVSRAVAVYALGLAFFGLQKAITPWFQAQGDMRTPVRVASWMVLCNATLNIMAVTLLPSEWRHVGLALSTVLCSLASCIWLGALACHRNGGDIGFGRLVVPVSKIMFCALAMAVVLRLISRHCHTAATWLVHGFADSNFAVNLFSLLPELAIGAAVYFSVSALIASKRRGNDL